MSTFILHGLFFSPVVVFIGLNLFLAWQLVLGHAHKFLVIKHTYAVNTFFLPACLLLVGLPGLIAGRGVGVDPLIFKVSLAWVGWAALFAGLRVWATHIEPNRLVVRRVRLRTPKVRQPLRVLHVSDIQSDHVGPHEARAFRLMHRLAPDLIVHTGDLLQPAAPATMSTERPKMDRLWEGVNPPLGKLGVLGDFDRWMREYLPRPLGGLHVLHNEEVVLEIRGTRLRLYGLSIECSSGEDPELRHYVADWRQQAAPGDLTLLLGHRPDYILSLLDQPIDLCLAGHTHGGQVRVPFFGPLMTESLIPRRWARGLHRAGQTRLNVSAGIGCEQVFGIPALRFHCPPEMTLIEFVPAEA